MWTSVGCLSGSVTLQSPGVAVPASLDLATSTFVSPARSSEVVFPLVVGCGRSGTTLLRSMLDAHPEVAVTYESHFIPRLVRRRWRYERASGFDCGRFVADLAADRNFRTFGLPSGEILAALQPGVVGFPDAVRRVFALYAERAGKPRYADKTPFYVLWMPLLARVLPEARFVHIIRDGRDTAASLNAMSFGPDGVGEAAYYWKERVSAGRRAGRELGPARYLEAPLAAQVAASGGPLPGPSGNGARPWLPAAVMAAAVFLPLAAAVTRRRVRRASRR